MKKSFQSIALVLFSLLLGAGRIAAKDAFNITIKIDGMQNQVILLGYYYGDKQYIRDSARCDASGKVVFKGKDSLDGGVYLIATQDRRLLFDFMVTEQVFTLETDTNDLTGNMKVKASAENTAFFAYSRFTSQKGRKAMELDRQYREAK